MVDISPSILRKLSRESFKSFFANINGVRIGIEIDIWPRWSSLNLTDFAKPDLRRRILPNSESIKVDIALANNHIAPGGIWARLCLHGLNFGAVGGIGIGLALSN